MFPFWNDLVIKHSTLVVSNPSTIETFFCGNIDITVCRLSTLLP